MLKKKAKKVKTPKRVQIKKNPRGTRAILIQGSHGGRYTTDQRHIEDRYEVKQRENPDGTIDIKLIPHEKLQKDRKEMTEKIAKAMGSVVDATEVMKDVLEDVPFDALKKLEVAIDRGAKPKAKEGCFYVELKDPRKKKPYKLAIRK